MNTEPESSHVAPVVATPDTVHTVPCSEVPAPRPIATSRDLATRALQAGAHCSQERVSELLGLSRRTLSQTVNPDFVAALLDAAVVEQAGVDVSGGQCEPRQYLDEREAAAAWLVHAMRDEHRIEQFHQRTSARRPAATAKARVAIRARNRHGGGSVKRLATTPAPPGPAPLRLRAISSTPFNAPATRGRPAPRTPDARLTTAKIAR